MLKRLYLNPKNLHCKNRRKDQNKSLEIKMFSSQVMNLRLSYKIQQVQDITKMSYQINYVLYQGCMTQDKL